jgi:hypothetical protein
LAELWSESRLKAQNICRIERTSRDQSELFKMVDDLQALTRKLKQHNVATIIERGEVKEMLTNATVNFFQVEINNEADGGDSPSTLDSAVDSLQQAPDDVVVEWCNDDAVMDEKGVGEFFTHVKNMREKLGSDTELEDLLAELT